MNEKCLSNVMALRDIVFPLQEHTDPRAFDFAHSPHQSHEPTLALTGATPEAVNFVESFKPYIHKNGFLTLALD